MKFNLAEEITESLPTKTQQVPPEFYAMSVMWAEKIGYAVNVLHVPLGFCLPHSWAMI